MANKKDVERAKVSGMYNVLALYKHKRAQGLPENEALEDLELHIKACEWSLELGE